jgi:hypothetical protein
MVISSPRRIDEIVISWFAVEISVEDVAIFGQAIGDPAGQHILECFAAYLSPRFWRSWWLHKRFVLPAKGNNLAMLIMMLKMKPTGNPSIGIIARESALMIAESSFAQRIQVRHIAGIANTAADILSRKTAPRDPGSGWLLPTFLLMVPEISASVRPRAWYRTLAIDGECRGAATN